MNFTELASSLLEPPSTGCRAMHAGSRLKLLIVKERKFDESTRIIGRLVGRLAYRPAYSADDHGYLDMGASDNQLWINTPYSIVRVEEAYTPTRQGFPWKFLLLSCCFTFMVGYFKGREDAGRRS